MHIELADLSFCEQGLEIAQERGLDLVCRGDAPAIGLLEGDQAGLAGEHLDRDAQDALEQLLEVELLREHAGDLEQVIALADAEIRQHDGQRRRIGDGGQILITRMVEGLTSPPAPLPRARGVRAGRGEFGVTRARFK